MTSKFNRAQHHYDSYQRILATNEFVDITIKIYFNEIMNEINNSAIFNFQLLLNDIIYLSKQIVY